ncbi:MAG: hypothetical protein K2J67_04355 [Lachnospiraceae bacterium]|nr:hypothetical protein [Lachnospiraceae bacterium]
MEEQSKFLEMLEGMKEIARAQDNYLTREEMKRYLGDIELSEGQWKAVCQYLGAYQIRVQGYEYVPDPKSGHAGQSPVDGSKIQRRYRRDLQNLPSDRQNVPIQEIRRFLEGDLQPREQIIESRLGQVVEIAERYTKYSVSLEELIAEGNLGLLQGMAKVESDRERWILSDGTVDVQGFFKLLEQEVINAIEQLINQETESKGQETAMLAKTNLLHESAKYLTEENGKIPTVQELSDYTRVPEEEIRQIMELSEDAKRVAET